MNLKNDNHWRNKTTVSPLYIQYLYLCKGYDGHLEELTRIFSISYVILDASLSEYRRHLLESECKQSGLRFISLSDEGSVRFFSKYKDTEYITEKRWFCSANGYHLLHKYDSHDRI